MIKIHVKVPDLSELLNDETRDIMRLVTFGTANSMQAKVTQPGTGKEYQRKNGVHIASAPGSPPATDTGNLNTSIQPILIDNLRGEINLADYGGVLEFGTDRAGRNQDTVIKPRPFIIPSLEEVLAEL